MRFLPLNAALHLQYELNFVGGEYSLKDEILYWKKRELRGEVFEVSGVSIADQYPKGGPAQEFRREIAYELTNKHDGRK